LFIFWVLNFEIFGKALLVKNSATEDMGFELSTYKTWYFLAMFVATLVKKEKSCSVGFLLVLVAEDISIVL